MRKAIDVFKMPKPVNVMGRSSSITNSFINGIIPSCMPSENEVIEALSVLAITHEDLRCAYCGDKATEWDHFRPIIKNKAPTGFISEIQNLVPACSKCNQSKGNSYWKDWMLGNAKQSPRTRDIPNLHLKVRRLEDFEKWKEPTQLNIAEIVGEELWSQYQSSREELWVAMSKSQQLASQIKNILKVTNKTPEYKIKSKKQEKQNSSDEISLVNKRIETWAQKPHLNVHKIIAIVVQSGGEIHRDRLIEEAKLKTKSKNVPGAIASLLTTKGNAYGCVFADQSGKICIHPSMREKINAYKWSLDD